MPERRGTDGRFAQSVSDEDILFFFETADRPFYGTGEVAERFDLSNEQARRRLESLAETGALEEVRVNERHTAWLLDRDLVVLRAESDGVSAHDTQTGVASGGEDRPSALRNLAEAIEAHTRSSSTVEEATREDFVDESVTNSEDGTPF
ncbi:hypothetical protein RYH80_07220 [Halobaculum sp. MBLA0147]|uniref:type II toxin-antitoxin system HicB family antitoxin n=1 Tax=Halobaculum sp. MBLA0147 TaxID=3079934 RepID=UPI0035256C05